MGHVHCVLNPLSTSGARTGASCQLSPEENRAPPLDPGVPWQQDGTSVSSDPGAATAPLSSDIHSSRGQGLAGRQGTFRSLIMAKGRESLEIKHSQG